MKYGIITTDARDASKELSMYIYNQLKNAEKHKNKMELVFNPDVTPLQFEVIQIPDKLVIDD